MHGGINDSCCDGRHGHGQGSQPLDQWQRQPPAGYAILVKADERIRHLGCSFFDMNQYSPIRRIALACTLLATVTACDKLGLGSSPTAPGPPAAGSTINYTAVGASDVTGVGSSVL